MKKIGIVCAYLEEADHIISFLNLKQVSKLQNIGIYENKDTVLALSGIGKIQASLATTILCEKYNVEYIINIGIAGNLKGENAKIGDVFLIDEIWQHDMYLPFGGDHLNYAKGKIQLTNNIDIDGDYNFSFHNKGICVTGDEFIDNVDRVHDLGERYNADVAEMEAFAVASVAKEYGKIENTFVIKTISDGADADAILDHESNLDFAMKNSLEVFKKLVSSI